MIFIEVIKWKSFAKMFKVPKNLNYIRNGI